MKHALCLAAAAVALSACETPLDAPLSPTFGQAVATLQSQVIPPRAFTTDPPTSSGARGALAIQRYERGEVREPEAPGASSATSAGALRAPSP